MSELHWSSPSRREGSRPLEPIPLEIYHEIFEYFRENDDMSAKEVRRNLANLALVCRFFSSIALPRIFAKMEFSGQTSQAQSTSRFCRALLNNQKLAKMLAQYVKTCTFSSWEVRGFDSDVMARARDAFFSMYCNALGEMTRVEAITFNFVPIDKRILKAMKKLPCLISLRFSRCSLAEGLNLEDVKTYAQTLRLRSLVIFDCIPSHIFNDAFASVLSFHSLKSFEADNWAIVEHLANYNDTLPLTNLIIHDTKDPCLLPILFGKTPELLQLHIYLIHIAPEDSTLDSIKFPASTLPRLSFFDGPPALAAALVPSRPISKVWLLGTLMESSAQGELSLPLWLPPLDCQLWEALGQSTAPIQEVAIPKHFYGIDSLKTYLPAVSTLKISWCHGNWGNDIFNPRDAEDVNAAVYRICNLWPPNPSVHQLVFDFMIRAEANPLFLDLQLQHQILRGQIVVAFPNIEQVNFITCINWRRSLPDGIWHAHVPRSKRRYILETWKELRDELVDYGDCFEAALKDVGFGSE